MPDSPFYSSSIPVAQTFPCSKLRGPKIFHPEVRVDSKTFLRSNSPNSSPPSPLLFSLEFLPQSEGPPKFFSSSNYLFLLEFFQIFNFFFLSRIFHTSNERVDPQFSQESSRFPLFFSYISLLLESFQVSTPSFFLQSFMSQGEGRSYNFSKSQLPFHTLSLPSHPTRFVSRNLFKLKV